MRHRWRGFWRDVLASAARLTPSKGYRWPSTADGQMAVRVLDERDEVVGAARRLVTTFDQGDVTDPTNFWLEQLLGRIDDLAEALAKLDGAA